jgi:hypothetical protein
MAPRTPKPTTPPAKVALDLVISLDKLTIGDLLLFAALKDGSAGMPEMVDLLDRCVVGGALSLPITALKPAAEALAAAMGTLSNPKN